MRENIKDFFKANGKLLTILVVCVAALFVSFSFTETVEQTVEIEQRKWQNVQFGQHPDDDTTCVEDVLIVEAGIFTYTNNITNTSASVWAYGHTNNTHLGSNCNYSTNLDIVFKVRVNATHAKNATSGVWNLAWIRCNITCSAFSLSNAAMAEYNISGTSSGKYIWVHYVNGTHSLSRGQNVTSCSFDFDAYFA